MISGLRQKKKQMKEHTMDLMCHVGSILVKGTRACVVSTSHANFGGKCTKEVLKVLYQMKNMEKKQHEDLKLKIEEKSIFESHAM